jgi:glycine cleavage system H protein
MYPSDRRYTKEHEWVMTEPGGGSSRGRVGITDFAQQQLGDVVFVELPEVGRTVAQGQACGTIESVKAVSELFSPVSGKVLEVNPVVASKPETVNTDPHGTWLIVLELSNPKETESLLTAEQYAEIVK